MKCKCGKNLNSNSATFRSEIFKPEGAEHEVIEWIVEHNDCGQQYQAFVDVSELASCGRLIKLTQEDQNFLEKFTRKAEQGMRDKNVNRPVRPGVKGSIKRPDTERGREWLKFSTVWR